VHTLSQNNVYFYATFCNRLVIPESPRWLVVNGKYEAVLKLLKKICRINNRCLPKDFEPTCLLAEVYIIMCGFGNTILLMPYIHTGPFKRR